MSATLNQSGQPEIVGLSFDSLQNPSWNSGNNSEWCNLLGIGTHTQVTQDVVFNSGPVIQDRSAFWISQPNVPWDTDWGTANITVKLKTTQGGNNATAKCQVHRFGADGTRHEYTGYSSAVNLRNPVTTSYTFTSFAWTSGSADDRIVVEWYFQKSGTNAVTITVSMGTADSDVVMGGVDLNYTFEQGSMSLGAPA